MTEYKSYICEKAKSAKTASHTLALVSGSFKEQALNKMADALEQNIDRILEANAKDVENGKTAKLSPAFLSRLKLSDGKILGMANSIRTIGLQGDPIGTVVGRYRRPNGLVIENVSVPLGVVGVIYESRPDVTVEATALCIKSGNAIILRGGKEAINSNKILADILISAAESSGIPKGSIQFVEKTERKVIDELIKLREFVDVVIPRGGQNLIDTLVQNSHVPVLESGRGNCHIYIDEHADAEMAKNVVVNAKVQSPSACNAVEKLLVHRSIADEFIPDIIKVLKLNGVEVLGCERTRKIAGVTVATEQDWYEEYLALKIAVKVVDSIDDAIAHINKYSTKHSEAIITKNNENAEKFLREVDSAVVYHNASTRFTDGGQFGFGGEIGISTQKMHARGPIGLRELTSTRYIVHGTGQIRDGKGLKIAIIGAGNMGSLIASTLVDNGIFAATDVLVTGHEEEKLQKLKKLGIGIEKSNVSAVEKSDVILLAVKPKDITEVCSEISNACNEKLVISIAAGVPIKVLSSKLHQERIIRAMPNIGAAVGDAFTAMTGEVDELDKALAKSIFGSFGKCAFFEEDKLDALTGIVGSGPAFVFLVINVFAKVAEKHGIEKSLARVIAAQIVLGSAKTVQENPMELAGLIEIVASKKGTTEAGLKLAKELELSDTFMKVIEAAIKRAEEISREKLDET